MKILFTTTDRLWVTTVVFPARMNQEIQRKIAEYGETYISHRICDDHEIPEDRTFRNAWRDNGNAIVVDMEKARVIANELTVVSQRTTKLQQLDPLIAAAKTPEELKQAIPAGSSD